MFGHSLQINGKVISPKQSIEGRKHEFSGEGEEDVVAPASILLQGRTSHKSERHQRGDWYEVRAGAQYQLEQVAVRSVVHIRPVVAYP